MVHKQLEDDRELGVGVKDVEDLDDVRVVEAAEDAHLVVDHELAPGRQHLDAALADNLHGDAAPALALQARVHRRKVPAPQHLAHVVLAPQPRVPAGPHVRLHHRPHPARGCRARRARHNSSRRPTRRHLRHRLW